MEGLNERRDFVDWVKNSDVVQLDDFTRDGFQTVFLTTTADADVDTVTERARDAGYSHRWRDERGRLVFSTSGEPPLVTA